MDYKTECGRCAVVTTNDKGEAKQITIHSLEELNTELTNLENAKAEVIKEYVEPIDREIAMCNQRISVIKSDSAVKLDEVLLSKINPMEEIYETSKI